MIADMPPIGSMLLWALALIAIIAYLARGPIFHRAPHQDADVSNLDTADGITEGQPACWNTGPRGGHYVTAQGSLWVCKACDSTWPRYGDEPYDQEAS